MLLLDPGEGKGTCLTFVYRERNINLLCTERTLLPFREGGEMQLKVLCAAALVAALGVILLPGSALSVAQIHEHEGLADYDIRSGKIAPTSSQKAMPSSCAHA